MSHDTGKPNWMSLNNAERPLHAHSFARHTVWAKKCFSISWPTKPLCFLAHNFYVRVGNAETLRLIVVTNSLKHGLTRSQRQRHEVPKYNCVANHQRGDN